MEWPKVAIVTPVHNGWAATSRYLGSIAELTYPNVETIIVDDGSTDGSTTKIREHFPGTTILSGDGSLWWAGATNKGAEKALERGAEFVFTCNNDVVLDAEVISSCVSCCLAAGDALVGSTIFYLRDRERVWFAGAHLDRRSGDIVHDTQPLIESEGPRRTHILTGMGMLIPGDMFRRLGGFDQSSFPHYLADCDLSLRAAANGAQLLVAPNSRIYNDVSSAWSMREVERARFGFLLEMLLSMRSAYWLRGRIRFYRRHWGPGWIPALLRLYRGWFRNYVGAVVKRRILSLAGRRRPQ